MSRDKATARIVGALFIVASAAAGLSQVVLGSLLDDDGYLSGIAADQDQIRTAALLDVVTAIAVVAIPVVLYPILKRQSETVSVDYLMARTLEAVIILAGALSLLALLALSQDFMAAAPVDASPFDTAGSLLLETRERTDAIGTQLLFALTALILYYSFYRTRIVPRFISIWGFLGALLMLAAGLLGMFGRDPFSSLSVGLAAPLAINEMVLAIWLIVKGFNTTAGGSAPVSKATAA